MRASGTGRWTWLKECLKSFLVCLSIIRYTFNVMYKYAWGNPGFGAVELYSCIERGFVVML